MSTVKSKTPTPQGISALLRKAGFTRAEVPQELGCQVRLPGAEGDSR